jgi:Sec-independent protein secretion pathway component TatC
MLEVLQYVLGSFWRFLAVMFLLGILFTYPIRIVGMVIFRLIRSSTIKKAGWPPTHIDADGDFKKEVKK